MVNLDDVSAVVDEFQTGSGSLFPTADVEPAVVNRTANIADAFQVSQAFQGVPYPYTEPLPCP